MGRVHLKREKKKGQSEEREGNEDLAAVLLQRWYLCLAAPPRLVQTRPKLRCTPSWRITAHREHRLCLRRHAATGPAPRCCCRGHALLGCDFFMLVPRHLKRTDAASQPTSPTPDNALLETPRNGQGGFSAHQPASPWGTRTGPSWAWRKASRDAITRRLAVLVS